jgi:hypothetical protein
MRVALYNNAAAAMFKLPSKDAGRPQARASASIDDALGEQEFSQQTEHPVVTLQQG